MASQRRLWAPFFFVCFVGFALTGCGSRSSVLSDAFGAYWSQGSSKNGGTVISAQVDMRYRYMRVEVSGRPTALMVMGYVDPHPAGEIESWYSAGREVIKIQNGRVVSTAGLETDWLAVRYPDQLLKWEDVPAGGIALQRHRDQMPGYGYGVQEVLWVTPLAAPPTERLPLSLPLGLASSYRWFQQDTRSSTAEPLPRAWFAWGKHRGVQTIVYSEQCLSPSLCLKMQRWPVVEATP